MTREGAPNGHHGQKVSTTGSMFYFCSKSFRRELMRGGGWSGRVSLSCSSKIFLFGFWLGVAAQNQGTTVSRREVHIEHLDGGKLVQNGTRGQAGKGF